MDGVVRELGQEDQLATELTQAGARLVVVDFTASWCGPCKRISPFVQEMASKYSAALFLKVDVDVCPETAATHKVTAMPTFLLFKSKVEVERIEGADQKLLEGKLRQYCGGEEEVRGMVDLVTYIDKAQSECLNEDDEHPFLECLTHGEGFLQSDCDEQIILSLAFNQTMKIHSLKVRAPAGRGPKNLRIFINQPNTLDFDKAMGAEPIQGIELSPTQLENGSIIPLKFVKFQNVQNIQFFIKDNQEGGDITRLDYLGLIGTPISTTNMDDFKRISGKKGERE